MCATRKLKSEGLLLVDSAQIRSSTTLGDFSDTSAGTAGVKLPHNQTPLCLQPALTFLQHLSRSELLITYSLTFRICCLFCLWFLVLRDTSATRLQHDWESNQLISGSLCLPEKRAHCASCSPQGHGVYATYNPNTQIIKPGRSWKRNSPNSPATTILSVALRRI